MKIRNVVLNGGPYDGRRFRVSKPGCNINAGGQRLTLTLRVGEHVGAYCLITGRWEARDPQP
jgi:hypothetical protein